VERGSCEGEEAMTLQPNPERAAKGMWWDRAWSLVDGCTPVSAGCDHCWSRAMAARFGRKSAEVRFREDRLLIPQRVRKPTVWAIWNDLFHLSVRSVDIIEALKVMDGCRQHLFLVLTKRIKRASAFSLGAKHVGTDVWPFVSVQGFPRNMWLGTSVEDQQTVNERLPWLVSVAAEKKFVSYEPALGPVDFVLPRTGKPTINWIIAGGETGPKARECDPEWLVRASRQCREASVPFWFKSWGRNPGIRDAYGDPFILPAHRREFPEVGP